MIAVGMIFFALGIVVLCFLCYSISNKQSKQYTACLELLSNVKMQEDDAKMQNDVKIKTINEFIKSENAN